MTGYLYHTIELHSLSVRDGYSTSVTQLSADRVCCSFIEVLLTDSPPLLPLEYLHSPVGVGYALITD